MPETAAQHLRVRRACRASRSRWASRATRVPLGRSGLLGRLLRRRRASPAGRRAQRHLRGRWLRRRRGDPAARGTRRAVLRQSGRARGRAPRAGCSVAPGACGPAEPAAPVGPVAPSAPGGACGPAGPWLARPGPAGPLASVRRRAEPCGPGRAGPDLLALRVRPPPGVPCAPGPNPVGPGAPVGPGRALETQLRLARPSGHGGLDGSKVTRLSPGRQPFDPADYTQLDRSCS